MIKILVDSACDISQEQAKKLGLEFLPIHITFADNEFLDGVNITIDEFYTKLANTEELPKTSQINEFVFAEKFRELTANGDQVILITLSSKLSGTYNNACRAAEEFNGNVQVIDSLNACVGERILVEYAMRLLKDGKKLDEIVKLLNKKKHNIVVFGLLDTLKNLKKGGRISPLVAFAGELFNVKPIVSVTAGEMKLETKAVGFKKGVATMNQLVLDKKGIDWSMPYVISYAGLTDDNLQKYLKDSTNIWGEHEKDMLKTRIGSTIGTHLGDGAIAISFFEK